MIVNGASLLAAAPIINMHYKKQREHGVSYGLGEAGYDIRIKQTIVFKPQGWQNLGEPTVASKWQNEEDVQVGTWSYGRFIIASAIEEFQMPNNLVGIVHDKSTWARQGLSVFNTVIEPGWNGFLTLELVFHGNQEIVIPAGAGIAQVMFHQTTDHARYVGKYQNQENKPVDAKLS